MPKDFIPSIQAQRVDWLVAFNSAVQANLAALNVPVALTTALSTTLATLLAAWAVVQNEATRTRPAINAKDQALANCVAAAREVAAVIQAMPVSVVSNELRLELGLPVHDDERTPVPAPATAPEISIRGVSGWTVNVQLINPGSESPNAKPQGVAGATIFMFVGDNAPSNQDAWEFFANVTRTKLTLNFPSTLTPGTKLWLTAFWRNPTDASGPFAVPVSTQINYGGLAVAS
jgi:hypothetical protein